MLGRFATARFGIVMGTVIALCLIVALVCVFCIPQTSPKTNLALDNSQQADANVIESDSGGYIAPGPNATPNDFVSGTNGNGTVYYEALSDSEGTYYEISAIADAGYVFGYWVQTSTSTKVSGDETIRVRTYSTGSDVTAREYVPMFIPSANVHYISQLSEITDTTSTNVMYILRNDITSVTTPLASFAGILDGNGHSINSISVSGNGTYLGGIVNQLNGGVIKDLTIRSGTVTGTLAGTQYVGAIAGSITNGLISRCVNNAGIRGQSTAQVAGVVAISTGSANTSALYYNENHGSVIGGYVGAVIYTNTSSSAYLIKNVFDGSYQTTTVQNGG